MKGPCKIVLSNADIKRALEIYINSSAFIGQNFNGDIVVSSIRKGGMLVHVAPPMPKEEKARQ